MPCDKALMKHLLPLALLLIAATPAAAADPENGAELAGRWCAQCHDVKGHTTSDRIPGWRQIVNERGRSTAFLKSFLVRPHGEMPPIDLSRRQIDDIVAYIETLKTR